MASSARITLLFILLAVVVCALLNAGNFGTIDTARRWQVARSIRLGEPTVTSDDVRQGFGIPGRNGVPHAWYGVGQSLLLLPIDALVDATVSPLLRRFGLNPIRRKQVAELTVAFFMQAFLTACVLLLARRVLLTFGFGSTAAVAGSLTLLFATTCLQYVQCAQENELLLALALAALAGLRAWHREARRRWVLLAGMACGFAILVRVTSLLETGVFASVILQAASTVISPNVEVVQRNIGSRQGVLWNRAVNIAQIATNSEDPQRFTGIPIEWRTLTYFPFQLRLRFPRIAVWGIAGWAALFLSLPVLISALWLQARRQDSGEKK